MQILFAYCAVFLYGLTQANEYIVGNWYATTAPGGLNWFSLTSNDNGQILVAAASFGGVYLSKNFGNSWQQTSASDQYWQALASSNDSLILYGLVNDDFSSLFISTDLGSTWKNSSSSLQPSRAWESIACSSNGQYVVAAGFHTGLLVSTVYGINFNNGFGGSTNEDFFSVACSSSGQYMAAAAGYDGAIYLSTNFGLTWNTGATTPSTTNMQWISVTISADGSILNAVESTVVGGVYQSIDYGNIWTKLPNAPNMTSAVVVASSDSTYMAVSNYPPLGQSQGSVYVSWDSGKSWNWTDTLGWYPIKMYSVPTGQMILGACYATAVYQYTPGCATGYVHEGYSAASGGFDSCTACAKGTYESDEDAASVFVYSCTSCPEGTYSDETAAYGSASCIDCEYPRWTRSTGCEACKAIYVNWSIYIQVALFVSIFLVFAGTFYSRDQNAIAVLLILGFPLLDVCTDFAYIVTSKFYSVSIFVVCLLFFLHSAPLFLYKVVKVGATPSILKYIWWLGSTTSQKLVASSSSTKTSSQFLRNILSESSDSGQLEGESGQNRGNLVGAIPTAAGDHIPVPTIMGNIRFTIVLEFSTHDNLYIVMFEVLNWILAICCQLLTLLFLPMFVVFWFLIGVVLQMTKTVAISSVWNLWFFVWTGHHDFDDIGAGGVDTADLNYALLLQFMFGTVPQMIIQSVNNSLMGTWVSDPFAIFSFVTSVFMTLNVIYHYFYHSTIKSVPGSMKDIPLDRSIAVKISMLSIDWSVLDAKLLPYTRSIRTASVADVVASKERAPTQHADNRYTVMATNDDEAGYVSSIITPLLSQSEVQCDTHDNSGSDASSSSSTPSVAVVAAATPVGSTVSRDVPFSGMRNVSSSESQSSRRPPEGNINIGSNKTSIQQMQLQHQQQQCPLQRQPPRETMCPLTHRIMTDPVIAEDGYTYERDAIWSYFNEHGAVSPTTKLELQSTSLVPNRAVKSLVIKFLSQDD